MTSSLLWMVVVAASSTLEKYLRSSLERCCQWIFFPSRDSEAGADMMTTCWAYHPVKAPLDHTR